MAKIPTYDNLTVQDRALEAPRQTNAIEGAFVDQGSAYLAKGAQDVANTMATIGGNEQRLLDADAITRAEVAFKDAESEKRIELGNLKGINAKDVRLEAGKWHNEQVKKFSEGLENDTQRRGFQRLMLQRQATFMDFANRHQSQELENAWVASKTANIQSSANAIIASGADERVVHQERGRIESAFADIAGKKGWVASTDPTQKGQYENERQTLLTGIHKQVLQQLVEADPRRAQKYFDAAVSRDEIAGDQQAELAKFIRKGTNEAEGRDLSQSSIGLGYNGGIALLKKLEKEANDLPAGQREAKMHVIETARQFHEREFSQREHQKNYNQRQAGEQAYSLLRQGKDVPISVRNAMDPHAALTLEKHLAGEKVQTDWKTYNDLRRQAVSDPAGFAQRDLYKDFDKLHPKEREALLDLQGKAIKGGDDIKDVATLSQQLSTAHNLLKFSKSDQEKKGLFDRAAQDAITEEQKTRGRKLNFEERQKVIDILMVEGDTNGWFPGGGARYYQVQGTDRAKSFNIEVPASDRAEIVRSWVAKHKKQPTSEDIQRIYQKSKGLK